MTAEILTKTTNLLDLYLYICGTSEVPKRLHVWACLSLIAACVGDRVWLEKLKDSRLTPHLYVGLVGPPACGKGVAIERVYKMKVAACGGKIEDTWFGKTTAAHLIDVLGKEGYDDEGNFYVPHPKMWVVMDELADDVGRGGKGGQADDFIKLMTKLYTSVDLPVQTGTRSHGKIVIDGPCINWLFGTTKKWMREALSSDLIDSGFTSRVLYIFVPGKAGRYYRPIYPVEVEREEVRRYLLWRLYALHFLQGRFVMTPEAMAVERTWYMNRKEPKEELFMPSWGREQDHVLKLAMLFALADGQHLVIGEHHMRRAIKTSAAVMKGLEEVVQIAVESPDGRKEEIVEGMLRDCKEWTGKSVLTGRLKKRGVSGAFFRNMLLELIREEKVDLVRKPGLGHAVRWIGG